MFRHLLVAACLLVGGCDALSVLLGVCILVPLGVIGKVSSEVRADRERVSEEQREARRAEALRREEEARQGRAKAAEEWRRQHSVGLFVDTPEEGALTVANKRFSLPGRVDLLVGAGPENVSDARIVRDVWIKVGEVAMRGKVTVPIVDFDEVERLARYRLPITADHVRQIRSGTVLQLWVTSPRNRRVCEFVLGLAE